MRRRHALLAATASTLPAWAQQAKPIRLIVPYPPGGPLNIAARALADKAKDTLGTVIVDNRAGAGGNIGADAAATAAPDGTTLVMGAVATHAINPWLYSKMPYNALADFTLITLVAQVPNGARRDHRAFECEVRSCGQGQRRQSRLTGTAGYAAPFQAVLML